MFQKRFCKNFLHQNQISSETVSTSVMLSPKLSDHFLLILTMSVSNRAVLICDWSWIHKASKGCKVDWLALVSALESRYSVEFVYKSVFGSVALHCDRSDPRQWLNESTVAFLQRSNFHVEAFLNKRQSCDCGKESEVQSGSVDASIAVCIFENVILHKATHLMLLAGDGDFSFIVDWMKKQRSKPTFVLAVPFKNESVSSKLIAHTDHENNIFEFGRIPEMWLNGRVPSVEKVCSKPCVKRVISEKPRFFCAVCDVSCNSLLQLQQHLEGKDHRERAAPVSVVPESHSEPLVSDSVVSKRAPLCPPGFSNPRAAQPNAVPEFSFPKFGPGFSSQSAQPNAPEFSFPGFGFPGVPGFDSMHAQYVQMMYQQFQFQMWNAKPSC